MEVRKLPASAGADWLLGALRLLRTSPFGFGSLGLLYAGLWLATMAAAVALPAIAGPLQLVFFVAASLLVAFMIYAAQEVDAGRKIGPGDLLGALREGTGARMVRTLIPQAVFALAMLALLYAIVGQENLEKAAEVMAKLQAQAQAGTRIDPKDVLQSSLMQVVVGGLLVMAISVIVFALTITVLPDMLLADTALGLAVRRGFAAALRNLPAVLVCLILGFVLLIAISIGAGIVLGMAQLALGDTAIVLGNALLYGFFMCLIAGTMYFAWKQMLGDGGDASAAPTGVAM